MTVPWINRIGTAVPDHDIHRDFVDWASARLADDRTRKLFLRMAERSGIAHRWSVLPPAPGGGSLIAPGGFYECGAMPSTAARMARYAETAPDLAERAVRALGDIGPISHLVVASCTGFVAPGVDQILAARLGLPGTVERVLVGFMGCYAAVSALRTARHIVRSEPEARMLVVTVELSTLHLRPEDRLEPLLAMLQFGDGAAAALVTADPAGLSIEHPFCETLPDSDGLISWTIGDHGFRMHLSGEVPGRIGQALATPGMRARLAGERLAVHAGGRSILDAVEHALEVPADRLADSRAVLRECGNMSSATLMFTLARMIGTSGDGVAVAFGPGLAAEGFRFRSAP